MAMNRRTFLRNIGAISAGTALTQLGVFSKLASAAVATDYKALVCIFLAGGNDGNNTIVPIDTTGYGNYKTFRGNLALSQASLLTLTDINNAQNYGLHPSLTNLQSIWNAGQMAVLFNVGTLVQPITQSQYISGSIPVPYSLFSHLDQQHQWQSSVSTAPTSSGWGGRMSEVLAGLNTGATVPTTMTTFGNNLYVTGTTTQALSIPVSGTFGYNGFGNSDGATRSNALSQLLSVDNQIDLINAAQLVAQNAKSSAAVLNPILTNNTTPAATPFANLTTNIAAQFRAVAKIIEAQASLMSTRQIFMVSLGGFDTHANQLGTQASLLTQLDAALGAFYNSMTAIGAWNNVTAFTLSDFSRTFRPNANAGSDHAWGNHHFILGGAVKGKTTYGTFPNLNLTLPSPDDVALSGQGRWIPTTSVDQYAATLATWFGVGSTDMTTVLPNLGSFGTTNLGFI